MRHADILIIGAGAVGTAIARELAKYELSIIVCDKNEDVGRDASKSCSSCVATAATMPEGTLEQKLRELSHPMVYEICEELDVPIERCGSLTVAISQEQLDGIPAWIAKAKRNGVHDAQVLTREELLKMEPALNPDVKGGIFVSRDGQINQFMFVAAMAENAAENGVEFLLDNPVIDISVKNNVIDCVETKKETIKADWVINCAGLYSDEIARMVGDCDFAVHPRKGEFFVIDGNTKTKVSHIIRPIAGGNGHGTLVIPTVDGNILVGPNAEDIEDKIDKKTTARGLNEIKLSALELIPELEFRDTITQFAGLRPVKEPDGYDIRISDKVSGYVGVYGIRSTGLTSSPGIACYTVGLMQDAGLRLVKKSVYTRKRKRIVSFFDKSDEEKDQMIKANPMYGNIVCRCERITEAEIVEAIHRPVGAKSVDAIKRRVRAGMGRCQGGYCCPDVLAILARELGVSESEIDKRGGDSKILG